MVLVRTQVGLWDGQTTDLRRVLRKERGQGHEL